MKPAPFDYVIPGTLEEAIGYLANDDIESHVLAGGQSLVAALNMRMSRPELLVDLGKLDDLDYVREEGNHLALGAMATKRSVEFSPVAQSTQPLLHAATMQIAHPQIRNRGTVGGSIAHADPAAEYPAAALVLDAQLVTQGPNGRRTIDASDFFLTYFTTALEEGEILIEVRIPAMRIPVLRAARPPLRSVRSPTACGPRGSWGSPGGRSPLPEPGASGRPDAG